MMSVSEVLALLPLLVGCVLLGMLLTLVLQGWLLKRWFVSLPLTTGVPYKPQYDSFSLPRELVDALNMKNPEFAKKKESCICLNLLFQFLFRELRDTKRVRNWVQKKMNVEFAEMLQTTTGKLLDQITVRDFNLGGTFPIVRSAAIQNVVINKEDALLDEVTLQVDLTYNGGFQLAVDVDLVFGKSAYLSVKVTKLQGVARLQFNRIPYTHWSFTFIEDPVLEFEVDSHFEGRSIPQITSLIINQIRRSVRKKHTLPNYKFRYKPFFVKPTTPPTTKDIYFHGNKLTIGSLEVTVIQCSRLQKMGQDSLVYVTLALDSMPWVELMSSRRKLWVAQDVELVKTAGQNIGLTFREEFIVDKYEEVVVVDSISPDSPASRSDIRKNDVMVAVNGTKVTSSKQAAKLLKQASDKVIVRVDRSSSLKNLADFKVEEDTVSLKRGHDPIGKHREKPAVKHRRRKNLTTNSHHQSHHYDPLTRHFHNHHDPLNRHHYNAPLNRHHKPLPASPKNPLFNRSRSESKFQRQRDSEFSDSLPPGARDEHDDYVNITITTAESEGNMAAGSADTFAGNNKKVDWQTPKRSSMGNISGAYLRRRGKLEGDEKTPPGSPALKREEKSLDTEPAVAPPGYQKKRSKSDVTPIMKEKERLRQLAERGETTSLDGSEGTSASTEEGEGDPMDAFEMKKTKFVKASQTPVFQEKFVFDIEEKHSYLNLCIWCKIPQKLDKQNRVVKAEKDVLLGHVSLPIMDVALECLSTLQGDTRQTYSLTPAEIKTGASRNKFSNLSAHSGFDEKLCYGDVTLDFRHETQPLTNTERHRIEKIRVRNEEMAAAKAEEPEPDMQAQTQKSTPVIEEGKHNFVVTHFQTVTYCNFCRKKIWLKSASQCTVCKMVSHKKCTEKCQGQTVCSKGGFEFKGSPPPVKKPLLPEGQTKEGATETKGSTQPEDQKKDDQQNEPKDEEKEKEKTTTATTTTTTKTTQQKSSFLSKFRKDSAAKTEKESGLTSQSSPKVTHRSPSPDPSSDRKRHNSAPEENNASAGSVSDGEPSCSSQTQSSLDVNPVPRTRSSASLNDLEQGCSPSRGLKPGDVSRATSGSEVSSPDSTDSEEEMNLLKIYEQQKASQSADEMVVLAAKQMGKELYAYLSPEERREKLDGMISKLQQEIDQESENRAELGRVEREVTDPTQKTAIKVKIEKSDEKIQSLALLMLHYCAGLQHCLDQQELERQKKERELKRAQEEKEQSTDSQPGNVKIFASKMKITFTKTDSMEAENSTSGESTCDLTVIGGGDAESKIDTTSSASEEDDTETQAVNGDANKSDKDFVEAGEANDEEEEDPEFKELSEEGFAQHETADEDEGTRHDNQIAGDSAVNVNNSPSKMKKSKEDSASGGKSPQHHHHQQHQHQQIRVLDF